MAERARLYVVLSRPVTGYTRCAEACVAAGVHRLQLRMKGAARAEVLAVARRLRDITRGSGTQFLVNDDPDLAAEAGADGVHIGPTDGVPDPARWRALGLRVWGYSTHNADQLRAAGAWNPDYVGIGPVFATPTKHPPDPVLGLEQLRHLLAQTAVPAVAIGGIDATHLREVLRAGVKEFAVVRAVCAAPDPGAAIRRLLDIAGEEAGP